MDHGILNIPLSKRGDIDAQLDRYKAQKQTEARAAAKAHGEEMKALRQSAHALLDTITEDRLTALAARCGKTRQAMRKHLRSECHWQPRLVIGLFPAA